MNTIIYKTKKLLVREFTLTDIGGNYLNWFYDQEVTQYNPHGLFPYTLAQKRKFKGEIRNSIWPPTQLIWAVISLETDEHIGNVTLKSINWINHSAEFSCVFGEKKYWGKGYATEALSLLIDHGFNKLNLHRIWTGTAATNIGMIRVAKKLGMIKEGAFREATFLQGRYVDILTFGLLRSEWNERHLLPEKP